MADIENDVLNNNIEEDEDEDENEDENEDEDDDDDDDDDDADIEVNNDEDEDDDEDEEDEDDEDEDEDDKDVEEEIGRKNKKKNIANNNLLNNNLIYNIPDLQDIDSDDFLQKFDEELKENYISQYHPECLNTNFNEIKQLAQIKKEDNIIVDKLHQTIPFLTKFEKTKILGIRVKQLNSGAKPFISISENILDNFIIANKELEEKKLPFIIQRPLPNNTFEYWYIKDLEIF